MNDENLAADRATGFVFDDAARHALGARIHDACEFYRHGGAAWTKVQQRAMRQDFSWDDSAAHYEQLYQSLQP